MKSILKRNLKKTAYVLASLIIIAALLVLIVVFITPFLNQHKADFERQVSSVLKVPVTISKVKVAWYRYQPVITLIQTTIINPKTNDPLLQIDKLKLFFSIPKSLWHWQLVVSGVMIEGMELAVHRTKGGELTVKGYPVLKNFNQEPFKGETNIQDMLAWLSSQPRILLQDIHLLYTDYQGQKRSLMLNNFGLKNTGSSHYIQGDIALLQQLDTTVKFELDWKGEMTDLKSIQAKAYFYVTGLSLAQWLKEFQWQEWEIKEGIGSIKAWLTWEEGHLQKVQTICRFFNLALFSNVDKSTHKINRLSGNFGWLQQEQATIVAGEDLIIDFPSKLWPVNHFYLSYRQKENKTFEPILFNLGFVDFSDVDVFLKSSRPFLPKEIQTAISHLKPQGMLINVSSSFKGPISNWENVKIKTTFSHIAFESWQSLPSIRQLSGSLIWSGESGEFNIDSKDFSITHPYFERNIFFNELKGHLAIKKENEKNWNVSVSSQEGRNDDLNASMKGALLFSTAQSGKAELSSDFNVINLKNIAHYFPLKVMDPMLAKWLKDAFLSGEITQGNAHLKGPIQALPFEKNEGELKVFLHGKNINLHFAPDWPSLENINGDLLFNGLRMEAKINHANLLGIELKNLVGVIANLKKPTLDLSSDPIQTDFSHAENLVRQSVLNKSLGKLFSNVKLEGPLLARLTLSLPLKTLTDSSVKGSIDLANNKLMLKSLNISMETLNGNIDFSEKNTYAENIQGQLFKKPISISIKTLGVKHKEQTIQVNFKTQIAISDLEEKFKFSLSKMFKGTLPLAGDIILKPNQPIKIKLDSNLSGLNVDLPKPYGKKTQEKQAINAEISIDENKLSHLLLNYVGTKFTLNPSQKKGYWQVGLVSKDAEGEMEIPNEFSPQSHIDAKFKFIKLKTIKTEPGQLQQVDLSHLPSFDFSVDSLIYNEQPIGLIKLATSSQAEGLEIKSLYLRSPLILLKAKGKWSQQKNANTSYLNGTVTTTRLSELLVSLGIDAHNFIASNSSVTFNLNWPSVPYAASLAVMNGTVSLSVDKGRIVDIGDSGGAKMGIGRMLSLFSLQSIPRRLTFDFSDVFQKGFSFDSISGDLNFRDGSAHTKNLKINGPMARVDIDGRIGFKNKDYDLTLSVIPSVTSSIPLAAALINPYIGIAAWGVNKILGSPVSKITTYTYTVKGSWANPDWDSLSVKKGQ